MRDTYIKYLRNLKKKTKNHQRFKRWQWAIQMSAFHQYIVSASRTSASVLNDAEVEKEEKKSDRGTPEIFMELEDTDLGVDPIADEESKEASESSICPNEFQNETDSKSALYEFLQLPQPSNSTTAPTPNSNQSKISVSKEEIVEPTSSIETLPAVENYQNKKIESDAIDLLFSAYASTIRTFSGKRQAIAKLKVAEVIMEQEILHHEEQEELVKKGTRIF